MKQYAATQADLGASNNEPILDDPLVGWSEVLSWTGIPRSTIYFMIQQGRFPRPITITGKTVRWPKSDLIAWRESLRGTPDTPTT